jgi:hypothetical protein
MPPDLPPKSIEDRVFSQFPGWTWSQRIRETSSCIWAEDYNIQFDNTYRWVYKKCVKLNRPQFPHFLAAGLQNAREHLWRKHAIGAPDGQKKSITQLNAEKTVKQPSIITHFKLNSIQPRDQQIINTLIRNFDKQYLQRMLLELIITSNLSFNFVDNPVLHKIFKYLNPSVRIQEAIPTSTTIRRAIYAHYTNYQQHIINILRDSPGKIHISFNG